MSYGGFSHGAAADRTVADLKARRPFRRSGYHMWAIEGIGADRFLGKLPCWWRGRLLADRPAYTVYSYETPIAWVTAGGLLRIPSVKYSPTTTQHQWTVRTAMVDRSRWGADRDIVRKTEQLIAGRADEARTGRDGEWRNLDVRRAFVRTIRGITVHTDGPCQFRTVAPDGNHGQMWSYVGGEALDKATRHVPGAGNAVRADEHTFTLTLTDTPAH